MTTSHIWGLGVNCVEKLGILKILKNYVPGNFEALLQNVGWTSTVYSTPL